ncbi:MULTISPECIES: hypothetical protein [unclassified Nocardioides]|uniref:hypothetical protein n=1 Tax=unclassified Nocardioides TaxID=2615069 RepID=UPI003015354F
MPATRRPLSRALGALVALVLLLTACTGDDGDGDPGERPDTAPTGPTTAQYDEAQTLFHDLAGVLDETNTRAVAYQARVRTAWENDPDGFRKRPKVVRAVKQQAAVAARRDAALAALAEQPAVVGDEELGTAYRAFVEGYAAVSAYQDGFNGSYPVFLAAGDACQSLVGVQPPAGASYSETGAAWLEAHEEAAAPCLRLSAKLRSSTNTDVARLPRLYRRLVSDRNAAIERLRDGDTDLAGAMKTLGRVDRAFTRDYARATRFDARIATLVPDDLYQAVDVVFEERVGGSGSS